MTQSSLDKPIEIKHYLRVLRRRKGIIVLCAVATVCATLVALHFKPRLYESQVTLMVESTQLLSSELDAVTGGILRPQTGFGMDEERMAKVVGRIQSRPFLERVVRILQADKDPVGRAEAEKLQKKHPETTVDEMAVRIAVRNLQSRIRFASVGKGIYRVIVADYKAENAQLLAKWITELFVSVSNQAQIDRLKKAHEFGAEQLRVYEAELTRSEQALERYQASQIQRNLSLSMVRQENLAAAEALQRMIDDEVTVARVRLRGSADDLARLGLSRNLDVLVGDPEILGLQGSLETVLKNAVAERLAAREGALVEWPPAGQYRGLQADLYRHAQELSRKLHPDQDPQFIDALARSAFSQIDLQAEIEAARMLSEAIDSFKLRAQAEPSGELGLKRLENEVETNRKLLQSFQSQLVASDISQAVEITKLGIQIEILDPASLPLTPSSPNVAKIMLASLFLGPLIGVGMAFASELADPTLRTIEDFARVVSEPVLGTTPLFGRLLIQRGWLRRHWVMLSVGGVLLLTGLFYVLKSTVADDLANVGRPTELVAPEGSVGAER